MPRTEALADDLRVAQKALREIQTILDAIPPSAKPEDVFFEVGRAIGTAKMGLCMSGGR